MAKPKESFYFSHDCGASRDLKMIKLRRKHGWEGAGIFWAVIEALRETSNYEISIEDADDLLFEFGIKREIFDYLFKCGLLIKDGDVFYSESLKRRMELKESRIKTNRENGRKGGRPKKSDGDNDSDSAKIDDTKFQDVPDNPLPPEQDTEAEKNAIPQKITNLLKPLNKISPSPLEIKNLVLAAKAGCTQDTVKNLLRRKPAITGFSHSWQVDELMAQLRIDKGDGDDIDAELERRYGKRSN